MKKSKRKAQEKFAIPNLSFMAAIIVIAGTLLVGSSCQTKSKRAPSSVVEGDSCFDLMLPIVDEFQSLRASEWEVTELAQKGLIDEDQYLAMRQDEGWQKFISRENQSDEEKEMGFVVLSLLRKRFNGVDEARLKDRYKVLMAFCGR